MFIKKTKTLFIFLALISAICSFNIIPLYTHQTTGQAHSDSVNLIDTDHGYPIFWQIGRFAGIGAFVAFTLVIIFGLLMTSKFFLRFPVLSSPKAVEVHSFNATFIALVLVIIHFASFIFDDLYHMTLEEALIPFNINRPDLRSANGLELGVPIAFGIFAFYISVILVITSRLKNKLISAKNWRKVHYLSFLFYVLFMAHAILAGTDSTAWWMKTIYITSGVTVITLILLRIFGKKYFISSAKARAAAKNTTQISEPLSQSAKP